MCGREQLIELMGSDANLLLEIATGARRNDVEPLSQVRELIAFYQHP